MAFFDKIRRFRALERRERFLLIEASATLVLVRLMLRLAPQSLLAGAFREQDGNADVLAAADIARISALAVSQQIASAACLPRALTTQRLLRRRGIAAALRIGGCIDNGVLRGHAWIEVGGRAIGEREEWSPLVISPQAAALWATSR